MRFALGRDVVVFGAAVMNKAGRVGFCGCVSSYSERLSGGILLNKALQMSFPSIHFDRHVQLIERIFHDVVGVYHIDVSLGRERAIYNEVSKFIVRSFLFTAQVDHTLFHRVFMQRTKKGARFSVFRSAVTKNCTPVSGRYAWRT